MILVISKDLKDVQEDAKSLPKFLSILNLAKDNICKIPQLYTFYSVFFLFFSKQVYWPHEIRTSLRSSMIIYEPLTTSFYCYTYTCN